MERGGFMKEKIDSELKDLRLFRSYIAEIRQEMDLRSNYLVGGYYAAAYKNQSVCAEYLRRARRRGFSIIGPPKVSGCGAEIKMGE